MFTIALAAITVTKLTMIPLATGYSESDISGISSDGKTVVGYMRDKDRTSAFIWDEKKGTRDLGSLSWNLWRVGGSAPEFDEEGNPVDRVGLTPKQMRWARSVAFMNPPKTDLKPFRTPWLFGESADGKVCFGNGVGKQGSEGFVWTKGSGAVGIGDLPGGFFYSQAIGISPDGNSAVGCSKSFDGITAALWQKAAGLAPLRFSRKGTKFSRALCCSSEARIVGGEVQTDRGMEAAIWASGKDGHLLNELVSGKAPVGWSLTDCSCVSDDGLAVAGVARDKDNKTRVWIARIVSQ